MAKRVALARRSFLKGALATAPLLLGGRSLLGPERALAQSIGPSTQTEAYLLPSIQGVHTVAILTVGDAVDGYRMVGIPDGLGAFRSGHGQFTLLVNHEITAARPGITRAHGSNGAFVSRWIIDRDTLEVIKGEDLTPSADHVFVWNGTTHVRQTTQWQRLCSGDLPVESALFAHGKGTRDRIFFDGEEVTTPDSLGRAWARIVTGPHAGEAWQLPRLGRMSFENAVASPHPQDKTIIVLTDDADLNTAASTTGLPSEVYVYVGTKQKQGHPIVQAGLTNGDLYGVKISVNGRAVAEESNEFGLGTSGFVGSGRFSLHNLGDVSALSNRQLEDASIAAGVTRLQRPEDGSWDPRHKHANDFYFVTTASLTLNCRLWRLRFDDIEHPEQGGTIEMLLRGNEGHGMLDNVTIDHHGRILMDEDPGNAARVSKIWLYSIATGQLIQVAAHNPKFFDAAIPNNPAFITIDEESSGIIDAGHILGRGWFLLDVQAHRISTDPELVEGGQLLAMFVDPRIGARASDDETEDEAA